MTQFRGNWDTGERRNFRRIMVVGGGRAGVAAAEELRRQGFGGEVVIMCDEPEAPYDRPSCSKGLLSGKKRPRDAKMMVQEDLAIHWERGRTAVYLDPVNRTVVADTDEQFSYDGLVIATGSRAIWPNDWPSLTEPGLHQLHGLNDAWKLRQALYRAKRVAVVGGGLTGCEVACTVRSLARECVLIDSKQQVMSRAVGEVAGRYVTEEVARDGVELRLGRRVKRIDRGRKGWVLTLDDASEVTADLVVGTIGERCDTAWLEGSGFDISDGVLCDEQLRVVGAEDVVACGTVARWPNLRYSLKPRRVGQWIMALEQGRAAAASLLRSDHPARPAALVPRYWSEQFGLRIQVCGEVPTDGSAEMTVSRQRPGRRDTARAGVLIGYHRNGEQVGLVAVNAARSFTTTARMMLASPPKLIEPEPIYNGPPMLAAAPAGAPGRYPGGQLAIEAAPADRAPVSPAPRDRFVIEAPPDAVHHHGYGPVPDDQYEPAPPYGYEPVAAGYGPTAEYAQAGGYAPAGGYGATAEYARPGGYGQHYAGAPPQPYGYEQPALGPGPSAAGYETAPPPAYGYEQPPPPEYGYQQPPPPGYGPEPGPGYEYGSGPPPGYGYEQPPGPDYGYEPQPYGHEQPAPAYDQYEPARAYQEPEPGYDYRPPDPRYDYGPDYDPDYGPPEPGYGPPAPISPPVASARPVSPPPRINPRDRFATDQFAAVR